MAISNFISTVWSEALARKLDSTYVGVANCSRDYDGVIKGKGSTVKVCSVGDITVSDYTKNTNMSAPQTLSDSARILTIDQAKSFNFQIDDVDAAQSTPRLMEMAMSQAASALAAVADRYVYTMWTGVTGNQTVTDTAVSVDTITDDIIKARQLLLTNGVGGGEDIVLEVSPEIAAIMMKAQILQASDNTEAIVAGSLGKFIGFDVFVSSNIAVDNNAIKCLARTKRAIAFAEQLSEVEAYRPESRFADAVKGLHLYGAKIIYPNEIVVLSLKPTTAA